MVFYEAPHKLRDTLADMLTAWGDREIALCRELTKLHEEVIRTTLSQAAAYYAETAPRGEFVLVIRGAAPAAARSVSLEEALEQVAELQAGGMSRKDAARQVAEATGLSRKAIYDAAHRAD